MKKLLECGSAKWIWGTWDHLEALPPLQQKLLGFLLPPRHDLLLPHWLCAGEAEAPGQSRALRMAVALVVAFFVLWLPYNLTLFLHLAAGPASLWGLQGQLHLRLCACR